MIEFGIDGDVAPGDACVFVTGRCYQGPLAVGDVFNGAYQHSHEAIPKAQGPRPRAGLMRRNLIKFDVRPISSEVVACNRTC